MLQIRQHFTLLKAIYSEDELASHYYYQLLISTMKICSDQGHQVFKLHQTCETDNVPSIGVMMASCATVATLPATPVNRQ